MYLDRGGVVWIGTMAGGISTFDLLKIKFAAHRTGSTVTTCFVEDEKGRIWIGTTGSVEGSGLYRFDLKTRDYVRYSRFGDAAIDRYWITSCIRDKKGKLWFGGERFGVLGLDPETEEFEYLPMTDQGEGANLIYAVAEAKGRIWIGTWGAGLISYDPRRQKFEQYRADPDDGSVLLSDAIYRIEPDIADPDILWVGTSQGGLSKFHISDGTSNNYLHSDEDKKTLSDNNVVSLLQIGKALWIGTYGFGLNRLDLETNQIERFGKEHGIEAGTIFGILADSTGRLWLSTNGDGLIVFDPTTETSQQYLARDGLQSREFAQGSYHKDSGGIFYFGGPRGFNAFDPMEIEPDRYEPPITLTQIKILDEDAELGRPPWLASSMELGFTDSVVSFEFAALAFADPANNRYQYRMNGLYDDWISTNQVSASYSNLDDGKYVFEVKAIGRHGATSQATSALELRVRPAPWESWWAYVIYGLILAGIVFAYVRYQNQRVKALEQANRLSAVERDLELTAAVQIGCLPENPIIREDDFTAFGVYNPAEQCSGDWWWYERSPNGRHWIIVGDVTGHGAGPAMVTAAVAAAFRVQSEDLERDPLQRFERVNREVMSVARGKYHMVLSAVEIDPDTGDFVVYSAGGLPVFVIHNRAQPKTYGSPGTPLGRDNFKLGATEGRLNPGDRILVLTDGLPEIELANGKLFGMRRIAQVYQSTIDLPVDVASQKILEAAMNAKGPNSQTDDWTFVLAEWEPKGLR
jgi:serine phosphatase RsbU (regulator of sigma subunit)/streptogramin lyase